MEPAPSRETFEQGNPSDDEYRPIHRVRRIVRRRRAEPPERENETEDAIELAEVLFHHIASTLFLRDAAIPVERVENGRTHEPIRETPEGAYDDAGQGETREPREQELQRGEVEFLDRRVRAPHLPDEAKRVQDDEEPGNAERV